MSGGLAMLRHVVGGALLLLLAGCGSKDSPIVRVGPGADKEIRTFQVEINAATAAPFMGLRTQSPQGLRAAYLFENGNLKTRLDIPAEMLPDQRARVILTDYAQKAARVYFADNRQLDPQFDASGFGQLLMDDALGLQVGFGDLRHPFRRMSPDQFQAVAQRAGFDLVGKKAQLLTVRRVYSRDNVTRKLTLAFDAEVGAVTQVDDVIVSPSATLEAVSQVQYTELPNTTDIAVPYQIDTTSTVTLQGDLRQPTMELPVADAELKPGEQLQLQPGEEVVAEFSAPVGQGSVDPNTQTSQQTIRYEDIRVNTLEADYFTFGGK
ncbi:hypothetical protein [Calidithermus chliarophilus]|uniref:hypothetical protein n=1 Tax=Calidithermus chliarophilus TaxID=52023 RepID=UPI000485E158|nr:hypothetical protein [Calidithermus chliarophilus]